MKRLTDEELMNQWHKIINVNKHECRIDDLIEFQDAILAANQPEEWRKIEGGNITYPCEICNVDKGFRLFIHHTETVASGWTHYRPIDLVPLPEKELSTCERKFCELYSDFVELECAGTRWKNTGTYRDFKNGYEAAQKEKAK